LVDHMDDVISDVHKLNKLSLDDGFVSDWGQIFVVIFWLDLSLTSFIFISCL
jgi:hypothetical protein